MFVVDLAGWLTDGSRSWSCRVERRRKDAGWLSIAGSARSEGRIRVTSPARKIVPSFREHPVLAAVDLKIVYSPAISLHLLDLKDN